MIYPALVLSSVAIGLTLLYASVLDLRERRVPFRTWYPMLFVAVPMAILTYTGLFSDAFRFAAGLFLLSAMLCFFYYFASAYLHLFGGADAWAMIFITACIPLFPFEPYVGYPFIAYFPLSVIMNAVLLNLVTPLGIFATNCFRRNRGPLRYMFIGFPVDGKTIQDEFGFVMEEFTEDEDGRVTRRYLSFAEAIRRMIRGERRLYTRDFKRNPEEYAEEMRLYRKAGVVWISYGVPFIIPICAGFLSAIFIGDIMTILIQTLSGVV
ncbi:A24 family peptidase C-terminal domain-containing protein [Methanogenium organophilum]|uniref:Prepilin peptidase n=1 Tax=Methanogenium organophilum TaxID=2199 RepID=A0A9X9T7T7_METOG|nr:A24 family peptidase C-terminal domain-containing protein [Methanogenium organophilum]WAI00746.1 prepilin peptidase [Methanogenium organophilum]